MTQQIPLPTLSLSSRQWNLRPLQPLSASVRLVQDIASNPPTPLALKTITLPSQTALDQTLREAALWQQISHPAILKLHDVFQHNQTVSFLMEYCPTGPLTPRSERLALRAVSAIASALDYFLSLGHSAHANISTSHILLDARGAVKLAGFGYTRANRLATRPKLNELDDVRALAAVLFELIVARVYDPDNPSLPSSISQPTALLLKNVLFVKTRHIPQLMFFRYHLAAARGLVPSLESTPNSSDAPSADRTPPPRRIVPDDAIESEDQPNGHRPVISAPEPKPPLPDVSGDTAIELVRKVTADRHDPVSTDDIDLIVRACATEDGLPEKVFKVFFTLPISKNPVVAFNTITLLHYLLAEGPAKLTALAITHDGFLSWAESSWTRARIQSKSAKMHESATSFASGEIAWYMALLRKRIVFHAKFAQVLSTHWVPRPDGLASLGATRAAAVKSALEIVQSCGIFIRTVLASRDLLATLKQSPIPVVVSDLAKAYLAICWFYATSDDQTKPLLNQDFGVAHNATRLAMEAVKANGDVAAICASNFLLELKEDVPVELDSQKVTSALKKKKKKKKKKVPTTAMDNAQTTGNGEASDGEAGEIKVRQVRKSTAPEPIDDSADEEDGVYGGRESEEMLSKRDTRVQNGRRVSPPGRSAVAVGNMGEAAWSGGASHPVESGMSNGRQKLSLDVRRAAPRPDARVPPRTAPKTSAGYGVSPNRSPYPDEGVAGYQSPSENPTPAQNGSRQRISTAKRVGASKPPIESRVDRDFRQTGHRVNGKNHASYHGVPVSRRATDYRDIEQPDSESESSDDDVRKSSQRRKAKSARKHSRKRQDTSESSDPDDDSDEGTKAVERKEDKRRAKKVMSRPKSSRPPADERTIPFDKEPPKRPSRLKKATPPVDAADYRGGSREALAAAASGKKTPSMNPKFEVAPYEVQFGPQIGSGGFGVVFKAKFRTETVAIKKIHAHALSNANSVAEFQSEVAVLCTLNHPNILRFVGACTKPPNLMIITEFMARGTLFDLLHQSQTRVTWPMRKKFALDTCKGMRYLHDSKLLHRDLKSSNLMLDKDFNCKVGDFGLTRISRGSAAVQMTGQCGTFQYMAVEVLANKPYSEKADVFSFGILLWEMVARKLPYFGMQPMQVAIAVLQQGMRPPMPAKCPVPLAKLMRACWDSDPNRRPSFAQLVEALEAMPE
eukprot:GFKZ01005946.1.p1 GENE.GFKZ01005946.1~~GFKZ01005946.1.p1  ORF type:complete len:1197 (+),score=199.39 GFKZ01005946.1:23-3592(+)